jgi:hypothetical protein
MPNDRTVESPTPRTDALIERQERLNYLVDVKDANAVIPLVGAHFNSLQEHARELERELAEQQRRIAKMREVLLRLDERGGLGFDMHDAIKEALGVPSGKFCTSPRACLLNDRCQSSARGFACND